MRMTKVIREYITEEIKKKYQPAFDALKAQSPRDQISAIKREVCKELEPVVRQAFREKLSAYYTPADLDRLLNNNALVAEPYHYSISPIGQDEIDKKSNELYAKREQAIKDVLVTMELGGTKEQLDEMLAKINPEEVPNG